jgi:hypothetical protein
MKVRTGCLGLLVIWTLLGVYIRLTGGFGEEGGGRLAAMGLLGVCAYAFVSVVERSFERRRSRSRAFPVRPRHRGGRW